MHTTFRLATTFACLIGLAACNAPSASNEAATSKPAAAPPTAIKEAKDADPLDLGLAGYAKVLCSALFVSNRDEQEAITHAKTLALTVLGLPQAEAATVSQTIDRERKLVRTAHGDRTRTAQFYGDQRCVIHPEGESRVFFTPTPVETRLPDASTRAWPMGDQPSDQPAPRDVDIARVKKDTQLESWSMGYIIKRTVAARGEDYLTYPQRALFDEIGIRKQVLETDPYGNFLLTAITPARERAATLCERRRKS